MPKPKQRQPSPKHLLEIERNISKDLLEELDLERAKYAKAISNNSILEKQLNENYHRWIDETQQSAQLANQMMILTMETTKQKHQLETISSIVEGKPLEAIASILRKDLFSIGVQVVKAS